MLSQVVKICGYGEASLFLDLVLGAVDLGLISRQTWYGLCECLTYNYERRMSWEISPKLSTGKGRHSRLFPSQGRESLSDHNTNHGMRRWTESVGATSILDVDFV